MNFTEIEKISSSDEEVSPLREEKSESPEIEKEKSPSPPEKSPVPPVPPGNSLSHQPHKSESNIELSEKKTDENEELDVLDRDGMTLDSGKWYFVTKIVLTYCEKKLF